VVAAAVCIGGGTVALADDVSNYLYTTIDAEAEVLALNAGGTQGTTMLSVTPRNGDGKNGCNLTGGTSVTVSVSSSNTGAATVSPPSVTFAGCGDQKVLTVTPVGSGTATVSLRAVSNTTGSTFNLAPATFTVNVAPATPSNAAPSVDVTGVTAGAAYEFGSVPEADCSVNDAEDGPSSFAASLSEVTGPLWSFGLGSQEASCSYTDAGGLTAASAVTYSIVDTGEPLIALHSRTPANANGWNSGDVTITWSCSDPVSGVVAESVTAVVDDEGADQSVTGTCTDGAGNTASVTEAGINIDTTAPITTFVSRAPAPNDHGWNNSEVVVTWSCSDDGGSGVISATVSDTVDIDGAGQEATGTCTDLAGNTTSASETDINIDTTAPSIELDSRTPANAAGWNNGPVTVTWTCRDDVAGVESDSVDQTVDTEGADQSATGTCTDLAGNTTSATEADINIDTTAPSIQWSGGPADGSSSFFGSVAAAPTCTATDELSGVSGCHIDGYRTTVGTHTLTAVATDVAGNRTSSTRSYTVQPWTLRGFYQPVDMNGVWNAVKGGSTVPLKFEAFAGTTELTDPTIASFTVSQAACDTGATSDEIELTTSGATSLRYDSVAGQFIQNWQTSKKPGACYWVTMKTADGSEMRAAFKLK
jgi:hypothetical protein